MTVFRLVRFARANLAGGIFAAATAAVFLLLIAFAIRADLTRDEWIYGDWVINYAGGFVRRGLIGSLLLQLQPLLSPPAALAILHLALYGTFVALLVAQFWRHRTDLLIMALLFAPIGLLFFAYTRYAIGRKEILFFVVALVQTQLLQRLSERAYLTISLALSVVLILSHEGLYFFCPLLDVLLFVFLVHRRHSVPRALTLTALVLCVQTVLFLLCFAFKGTVANAEAICASLGAFAPSGAFGYPIDCTKVGSIAYLGFDTQGAFTDLVWFIGRGYVTTYGLVAIIVMASLGALLWRYELRASAGFRRALIGLTIAAVAWSLPLYAVSTDWGRWLQITYLALLFLIMQLVDLGYLVARAKQRTIATWHIAAASAFLLLWSVPMCCHERIGFGVFGHGPKSIKTTPD